ncbi:hypothetical protein [Aeromonas phage AerS_266]|nr:hypothetical protein [Aeromonas phage AerS_266]
MFLEKDFTPDIDEDVEYKKITMEDFLIRIKEIKANPYYF